MDQLSILLKDINEMLDTAYRPNRELTRISDGGAVAINMMIVGVMNEQIESSEASRQELLEKAQDFKNKCFRGLIMENFRIDAMELIELYENYMTYYPLVYFKYS